MPEMPRMTQVDSSIIKEVGYDEASWDLFITFRPGSKPKTYRFKLVPPDIFSEMMAYESIGRYFLFKIKPNYEAERL